MASRRWPAPGFQRLCWQRRCWRRSGCQAYWWVAPLCGCGESSSCGRCGRGGRAGRGEPASAEEALTGLAVRPEAVPAVHRLGRSRLRRFSPRTAGWTACWNAAAATGNGCARGGAVPVADVRVLVASAADAWALRARFEEDGAAMGRRSGVGLVELAILEDPDARRAPPERPGGLVREGPGRAGRRDRAGPRLCLPGAHRPHPAVEAAGPADRRESATWVPREQTAGPALATPRRDCPR